MHLSSFVQNNRLDASNIQNLFCHKSLHVSGIFYAHHQELSAVRTAIGMFRAGYVAAAQESHVGSSNLNVSAKLISNHQPNYKNITGEIQNCNLGTIPQHLQDQMYVT
jgi:hypothetical protein